MVCAVFERGAHVFQRKRTMPDDDDIGTLELFACQIVADAIRNRPQKCRFLRECVPRGRMQTASHRNHPGIALLRDNTGTQETDQIFLFAGFHHLIDFCLVANGLLQRLCDTVGIGMNLRLCRKGDLPAVIVIEWQLGAVKIVCRRINLEF